MTTTAIVVFVVADVAAGRRPFQCCEPVVGGYVAAHAAQRLDERLIKGFIVV